MVVGISCIWFKKGDRYTGELVLGPKNESGKYTSSRRDVRRGLGVSNAWLVILAIATVLSLSATSGTHRDSRLMSSERFELSGTRVSGPIIGDVTWDEAGSPYWLEGIVVLTAGSRLIIEPGVRATFNGSNLRVEGFLQALGTPTNPVTFATNDSSLLRGGVGPAEGGSVTVRNASFEYVSLGMGYWPDAALILDNATVLSDATGINVDAAKRVVITGNRITLTDVGDGIEISNAAWALVSSNVIETRAFGGTGIDDGGGNVRLEIAANAVNGDFSSGVRVESEGALVLGNEVTNVRNYGIEVQGSTARVAANRVHGNGNGIVLFNTASTVEGNVVHDNSNSGIVASGSGDWVANNTVVRNAVGGGAGIRLGSSSNVTVYNNTVEGNAVGIRVLSGQGHRVFHNRISHNALQALDGTSSTQWDDGYPSGGNWWSDYAGDDLYQGPLQNLPGPDGIGDTPYVIDPDSQDRYPFYSVPAPDVPRELTARVVGADVVLTWRPDPLADAHLLYTSSLPTGFDFSAPMWLGRGASWTDGGAAGDPGPKYYVLRAHNSTFGRTSATSNTAGKWTHVFPSGGSAFSIPLQPYGWIDYAQPGWIDTVGEFISASGATSIAYMVGGAWREVPGADAGHSLRPGEGYIASFATQTVFTFAGVPGSVIEYAEWPPYPLRGFDPGTTAREVQANILGDDVWIQWGDLAELNPSNGTYLVYYAATPSGLRGYAGIDYELLATVPVPGGGRVQVEHRGAVSSGAQWFYFVVPVRDGIWRGASSYGVGVTTLVLGDGYSAIGLPLRAYSNGTYLVAPVSSLLGPELDGVLWFDPARGDWVAHAAWMPAGTYDVPFTMVMAVQVDVEVPTRITFVGV